MSIFVFLFFLLGVLSLLRKDKSRFGVCLIAFLSLWLIQALRDTTIGYDAYNTYLPAFSSLAENDLNNLFFSTTSYAFEPGYEVYMKLIRLLTDNENVFLAITSLFVLVPVAYVIYKYSDRPALAFAVFVGVILYHFSFSGLRQAIAISFCFLSFKFIKDRKLIPFLLLVLLAYSFHKSAIVFAPAYFLYNIRINIWTIAISALLVVISFVYVDQLALIFRLFLFGETKYSGYLETNGGAVGLTILYFVFSIFLFLFSDKKNTTHQFFFWASVMVLVFQPLGIISQVADRVGYYYLVFFCLSIPNAISGSPSLNNPTKRVSEFILLCFLVFFFVYCNAGGYLDVVPYKFLWE